MNNFVNERFPEDISYGAIGGPEYKTDVITSVSGSEYRNARWVCSRAKYNVSYGVKNKTQIDKLIAFFRSKQGRSVGFRFKDWIDYQAVDSEIGVGDGATSKFQLVKHYDGQGSEISRVITKPVYDSIKIFINDKIVTSGNYEIDYNNGIVRFSTTPAIGEIITATFEFDVPVRFDIDYLPISIEDVGVYSCHDIMLVEIK